MDLAIPRSSPRDDLARNTVVREIATQRQSAPADGAGTSTGINISPGSEDDGWVVPQPVRLHDGTLVQLYKDGEALHAAFEAIRQAKRRICLEVYIFADDPTGRAFAELLCKKAQDGLRVYVVYDSFGSINTDRELFRQMSRAGVRVEEFHPIRPWEGRFSWRPFNLDHRKLLVIDDEIAWLGGLNIGAEYAGSWVVQPPRAAESPADDDFWRDNAIGLRGPSAKHFLDAFIRTWRYVQTGGRLIKAQYLYGLNLTDAVPPPAEEKFPKRQGLRGKRRLRRDRLRDADVEPQQSDLGILASVATMDSPLRPLLYRFFRRATRSIQLTMAYFAPDDELIDSLCKAARRGVNVQLMLPGRGDVHALIVAARSFYETLLSCGVEIFERQGCVLHAKTMCVDSCVSVVGSTNLDYRSIEYNCELSAIIRNETFGRQMNDLFANDILYARRITLREWRRRPLRDRLVQWTVKRARYLL